MEAPKQIGPADVSRCHGRLNGRLAGWRVSAFSEFPTARVIGFSKFVSNKLKVLETTLSESYF